MLCTLMFIPCFAAPMPVCNKEPRLITNSMYTTNITFEVVWSYLHTEGLFLDRVNVVLSYTIPKRDSGQLSTRTTSEDVPINQTSRLISISSMNIHSPGELLVNITASNSQDSDTIMCPPLQLGENRN